ncbi:MAG: DNA-binding protein WhiA [Atopobiaceae bacterium]|jgi:DNA-binding protein WhiA|nr:DNA-binding protein WhiA [Olegusella sp.]NLH92031.1 DNA-binding protein WhiA [Atopobium sp.]
MSFTAQVKDELSRVGGSCPDCPYAELSAIVRVCGTLSFHGSGSWSLRVATETGAVARTMIKLTHELFDLETPLTVRRSNLHKSHNYLIEIRDQDALEAALMRLGVLESGRGLTPGLPEGLLGRRCCQQAYLRGAFMAGGFVSDPRGDFHLEIAVSGEPLAEGLRDLAASLGVSTHLNHRRGAYVVYLKSFEGVVKLLVAMGAERSALAVSQVRRVKTLKNDVNRRVNAEMANQGRSTMAAADQAILVSRAMREIGLHALPPALREFCILRRSHPELSLAALGKLCDPPVGKSAMHHRVLRLTELVEQAEGQQGD